MRFLDKNLVRFGVEARNAEEAIRCAGKLLWQEGLINEKYCEAMVDSFRKYGPYFVIAPHIAIPHARPEDGVIEASVSFVQLKKPVAFGHQTNDPVHLVFALGASSQEEHLCLLQKLSVLLSNSDHVSLLKQAATYNQISRIIEGEAK